MQACPKSRKRSREHRDRYHGQNIFPPYGCLNGRERVHHAVSVCNDRRQCYKSEESSRKRTDKRCGEAVAEIIRKDFFFRIAERFQRAYLNAVLLDGSRHCRERDERGDNEEEYRKYFCDRVNLFGI